MNTLYIDADEVIFNTIERFCEIMNERLDMDLHEKDIRTWNFQEYCVNGRNITEQDVERVFDLEEFYDGITYNQSAIDLINNYDGKVVIVTKGSIVNLVRKRDRLMRDKIVDGKHVFYVGVPLNGSKAEVDMSDGIFIDDFDKNLNESNAKVKILCMNNPSSEWNMNWNGRMVFKDKLSEVTL